MSTYSILTYLIFFQLSPPLSLESDDYQFDFSAFATSPLKDSLSDSFLPSYTSADFSAKRQSNSNRRTSVSPTNDPWKSVPKTDPWQSAPKTSVTDVPGGKLPLTSSPVNDNNTGTPFNVFAAPAVQHKDNGCVTLDPWLSNADKNTGATPKLKSTNPWANDVSEVNFAQSVAPTKTASANLHNNALVFDPLKSGWISDDKSIRPKEQSLDLFGNWDTAVKQMHQLPSHGASHMYNPWSQQNQVISTGQAFTTPSLI